MGFSKETNFYLGHTAWKEVCLMYQTTPSPALDVLHHQRREGRVWPLLHGFRGTGWNVDMTNEIQARVVIRKFECTWSKDQSVVIITCTCLEYLSVNTGDHTTSCYAHFPATCIPLCHKQCNSGQTLPSPRW